jgi:hypothetical protein
MTLNTTMIYLVTISIGGAGAYTETSHVIAIERVIAMGGKVSILVQNTTMKYFP